MLIAANYDENVLLARVTKGNREAFTCLYKIYLNELYRYIYLVTKSKEETEEILQDIFIKIWEKREKLDKVDSFKNYVFRIAKNKLIDKMRQLQTRQRVHSEIKRSTIVAESTTSDECAYREYYFIVQHAIEKLPPKRKLIFRLNIENGLSQEEIASQLNISRSVVQKQMNKASHFVREYLKRNSEIAFMLIVTLSLLAF